jgi:sporulation protein YlmC with PRC-barrel domain
MAEQPDTVAPAPMQEWRASHLFHRPVVHAMRVEHLGEVADVAFDPESCELTGLLVGPPGPEGNVLDMVRKAVGRDLGLTFVPAAQILALNGDVVMVEAGRAHSSRMAGFVSAGRATRWPQLRQIQGFAVVTVQGHRLGRLVDLVLDASGRRVTGYLITPVAPAQRPPQPAGRPFLSAKRARGSGGREPDTRAAEPASAPASSSNLLVVPASAHVRVGRDLIAVGPPVGVQGNVQQRSTSQVSESGPPTWPTNHGQPIAGPDPSAGQDRRHANDMHYPPDAPTEAFP